MAKLIYVSNVSLDGYIEDEHFDGLAGAAAAATEQ